MKRRMFMISLVLSLLLGYVLWQQEPKVSAKVAALPMAPLTVTNTNDSGAGSLRQAIADAVSGDTITFNLSGCPCTITLTSGELVINKNLTISGPGASQLTISGGNTSRVFFINPGAAGATTGPPATNPTVTISNLTVANGKANGGGGEWAFKYSYKGSGGGAAGMGGGIFINGASVVINAVQFAQNSAIGGNGGVNTFSDGLGGGGGIGGGGGNGTLGDGGSGGSLGGVGGSGGNAGVGNPGGEGAGGAGFCGGGQGGFGGGGGGTLCYEAAAGNGGFGGGGGGTHAEGKGGQPGKFGGKGGNGDGKAGGGGGAGLGGAIFIRAGSLNLTNSDFTSNSATGGGRGGGPAGANSGSGQAKGGAIFVCSATDDSTCNATANVCTTSFSSNTAADAAGSGTDTIDVYGSTTSNCNTAPTITATNISRMGGSPTSNAQIATVSDAEDAKNTLSVTATPATGSGVTLSGISVDTSGNVTANVAASCTATTSTFTLQVTDSGTLTATATLTVTVNANTPPMLSYPSNPGTVYSTAITVSPLTGPSDDLGVTSVVLQGILPSNPGGITVNSSGVVTVANTVPAGNYTVTIRANAACANTDASFTLGIAKAATTTVVTTNPASPAAGQPVTYRATVSSAVAGLTGSVQFQLDGVNFGLPVALVNGVATLSATSPASGFHTITASYSGDNNFAGSSGAQSITVWGYSMQDNTTGDLILFNANGSYVYKRCALGLTLTGTGAVSITSTQVVFKHQTTDRVLRAVITTANNTGTGLAQYQGGVIWSYTDSNTLNNTNTCP